MCSGPGWELERDAARAARGADGEAAAAPLSRSPGRENDGAMTSVLTPRDDASERLCAPQNRRARLHVSVRASCKLCVVVFCSRSLVLSVIVTRRAQIETKPLAHTPVCLTPFWRGRGFRRDGCLAGDLYSHDTHGNNISMGYVE
jgi:hypothetical protein